MGTILLLAFSPACHRLFLNDWGTDVVCPPPGMYMPVPVTLPGVCPATWIPTWAQPSSRKVCPGTSPRALPSLNCLRVIVRFGRPERPAARSGDTSVVFAGGPAASMNRMVSYAGSRVADWGGGRCGADWEWALGETGGEALPPAALSWGLLFIDSKLLVAS